MLINIIQTILHASKYKSPTKNKNLVIYYTIQDSYSIKLIERHYRNLKLYKSLEEISWRQILFRKIKFISIPNKSLATTTKNYWKRRFIKWLRLPFCNRDMVTFSILEILIFENFPNIIFTPSKHVAEIYETHLPNFKAVQSFANNKATFPKALLFFFKLLGDTFLCKSSGITVFANLTNEILIKIYKKLHPNKKIILRYHDKLSVVASDHTSKQNIKNSINKLISKKIIDEVESYYLEDAKYLNCTYRPNGVNPLFMKSINRPYRTSLVYFLGVISTNSKNISSNRLHDFKQIQQKILELYPQISERININQISGKDNEWLSYNDYARNSSESEIYIDLFRVDQNEGFSYRIPEALFLNRKIITNRTSIKNEIFYDKNRIFIIGIDPLDRLQAFIESPIKPLSNSILKYYDSTLWWTNNDPIFPLLSEIISDQNKT